jgi:hypothetical protein
MIAALMRGLFGCRHKKLTRPITPAHKPGTKAGNSYVACLDCGSQFHYDTQNMTMGPPVSAACIARPSGCYPAQTGY